jgi:hypothetical protein
MICCRLPETASLEFSCRSGGHDPGRLTQCGFRDFACRDHRKGLTRPEYSRNSG